MKKSTLFSLLTILVLMVWMHEKMLKKVSHK